MGCMDVNDTVQRLTAISRNLSHIKIVRCEWNLSTYLNHCNPCKSLLRLHKLKPNEIFYYTFLTVELKMISKIVLKMCGACPNS